MMPTKKHDDDEPKATERGQAVGGGDKAAVDEVVDGVRIRVFATDGGYEAIAGDEEYTGGGQHNVQCYSDAWPIEAVTAMARQQLGVNLAPATVTDE